MKIEKVHIKNIKGIKDLELSFKKNNKILDVIVLAGVNGSGKTTILESIKDFFYSTFHILLQIFDLRILFVLNIFEVMLYIHLNYPRLIQHCNVSF